MISQQLAAAGMVCSAISYINVIKGDYMNLGRSQL